MAYYPENAPHWERIRRLVDVAGRIYISTHVNPDGDAVGSVMALAGLFSGIGKRYRIILQSQIPESYRFLDPEGRIESYPAYPPSESAPGEEDLVIFVDMGRFDRAGTVEDFLVRTQAKKIVIDHHRPESPSADLAAVNPRAESTGSLVYDMIGYIAPHLLDERIAIATLTAIVTDTGFFRYSNTTALTHRIAASLYDLGARVGTIRRELETGQPFPRQKLLGLALSNVRRSSGGRIAYMHVTSRMFEKARARREHTDGIIDHVRVIQGAKVAALIVQEGPDLFKVSFRTAEPIPANEIASLLGGGGHPRAAGATLAGSLEQVVSLMLRAAETILATGKE